MCSLARTHAADKTILRVNTYDTFQAALQQQLFAMPGAGG